MMKLYRHIASWVGIFLLAALLTGCAKESSVVDSPEVKQPTQPTQPAQTPIALSAYTAQPIASTRADEDFLAEGGIPNNMSIGVYAYYHENSTWAIDDAANPKRTQPDFMFNQKATNEADKDGFSYSPLKYWPNTDQDKLSFIGYYPYTDKTIDDDADNPVNPESKAYTGITPNLAANGTGLPSFDFIVKNDVTKQVDFLISDLLTNLPNGTSAVSPSSASDREHLTIVDKVRLLFHHATSKVTIRISIDKEIREDFMSMTISNLELTNIYRKGTVTPTYNTSTGTTINVTNVSESGNYIIVDASVNPVVNHLTDTYLMLPQTLVYDENEPENPAKNAQIKLTYSIKLRSHGTVYTYEEVDDNKFVEIETDHYTYSNTASLPLAEMKRTNNGPAITTWDPNHHYVYTIRLGAKRIEFTGEVVDWGQEVPWDNIVVDQIGGS